MNASLRTLKKLSLFTLCLLTISCGGGGGGSSSASDTASGGAANVDDTPINDNTVPDTDLQRGQFLDSAVSGLWYETETQEGYTDESGYFEFIAGETIRFYLGNTLLGEALARGEVTPLDLLAEDDDPDKLQNILRVLQTLDADGDASNGIDINEVTFNYLDTFELPLNNPAVIFEGSLVVSQLLDAVTNTSNLKDALESFLHFNETLISDRRDTTDEIILDLVDTNWSAAITSSFCPDITANVAYSFNVLGIVATGNHGVVADQDEDGGDVSCRKAGWGVVLTSWHTEEILTCANECTFEDLNRIVIGGDESSDVITVVSYNVNVGKIIITISSVESGETITKTLTPR